MATTTKKSSLTSRVNEVMTEIKKLYKAGENKQQGGYFYVSVDDVKEHVRPLLVKAGIQIVMNEVGNDRFDTISSRGIGIVNMIYMFEFRLICEENEANPDLQFPERISVPVPFVGGQTAGQARSYALKEFLKGRFMIATSDHADDSVDVGQMEGKAAANKMGDAEEPQDERKEDPEGNDTGKAKQEPDIGPAPLTEDEVKSILADMNDIFEKVNFNAVGELMGKYSARTSATAKDIRKPLIDRFREMQEMDDLERQRKQEEG